MTLTKALVAMLGLSLALSHKFKMRKSLGWAPSRARGWPSRARGWAPGPRIFASYRGYGSGNDFKIDEENSNNLGYSSINVGREFDYSDDQVEEEGG